MGKQGQELWDDSALINAFDQAISKYKKMHGKGYKEKSGGDNGAVNGNTGGGSAVVDSSQEDKSHPETVDGEDNDVSHATMEVREVENLESAEGNEVSDSQVPKEHALGSSSLTFQDEAVNHPSSAPVDEYNQLYGQYYEVEEQRQKILQRLQLLSGWNYTNAGETSVSGSQWGPNSAIEEYQSSTSQAPCGMMVVSCCPCVCPYSKASCSSLSCPSTGASGGTLSNDAPAPTGPGKLPGDEDVDFVKLAMGAAEKAISSLKEQTSDLQEDSKVGSGREQSVSSETDLSVVLSAWYSAGFHTGKYLTEKSLAKKRSG